jgi:hypothetical protein
MHNDELHSLYSSPNIVRMIKSRNLRWVRHVARMGEGRGVYRVLVVRPRGKRPLGRPRRRWEDNIKMDLREIRIDVDSEDLRVVGMIILERILEKRREVIDWIHLTQNRDPWQILVYTIMNFWVLKEEDNFLTI